MKRELPCTSWDASPLAAWLTPGVPSEPAAYVRWRAEHSGKLFCGPGARPASESISADVIAQADDILRGRFPYFDQTSDLGFPPDWNVGRDATAAHWSEFSDFSGGDIKLAWEPSRFTSAFVLGRAWARSGNERYAEAFWTLVEDWAKKNPPNQGVNWKCGQEASFRLMAWAFGFYVMADAKATTAERVALMATMFARHAERIEKHIDYARSQKNNHGISEAVGLWTVGLLFPEFDKAEAWREIGRSVLAEEVARQIYADGSYVQHSTNYHRVMLHDLLWAMRLGEVNDQPLPREIYERFARSADTLAMLVDPVSGHVPNYGANDGALVLPLTNCEFGNFRPVLQSGNFLLHKRRLFETGPWDEEAAWLFGGESLPPRTAPTAAPNMLVAQQGGYYTLRGEQSWAMLRCAEFKDRPAHADQLHLDLWWRGLNILCDAGTFSYNHPAPFDKGFADTAQHNTVSVDGRDQMTRASRFLWVDWARGKISRRVHNTAAHTDILECEHDGYRALGVIHRRAVVRCGEGLWVVVDDVLGSGTHSARLHWLAADAPFQFNSESAQLLLETAEGRASVTVLCNREMESNLVRAGNRVEGASGDVDAERGWTSPCYMKKIPALSLAAECYSALPARFVTVIQLGSAPRLQGSTEELEIKTTDGTVRVKLAEPGREEIVAEVRRENEPPVRSTASIHTVLIHQAFASKNDPGGTRHYELSSRLVARGQRFTIVASDTNYTSGQRLTPKPTLLTEEDQDGVRILRAYTYPSLHKSFVWRVVSFLSFMATSLFGGLRAGRVDLVMGTTPPIFQAVTAWVLSALRRKPLLLEVRDLWPEFAVDMGVLKNKTLIAMSRWLEMFLYRHATHILVNSPAYREYIIKKGITPEKVSLVANGVDAGMFDPTATGSAFRQKYGLEGRFVVTYAGAMGLANDLGVVMKAAALVRDCESVRILMVGDGKERANLEKMARDLGLDNVVFTGSVPKSEMQDVLAASDACLAILKNIPMFNTTYPNKVFDYMAAGRPTLLAIDGVIRKVIEDADGGFFVPPGDEVALASAIRNISSDPERAREMGRKARAFVVGNFNRETQSQLFEQVLTEVATGQR